MSRGELPSTDESILAASEAVAFAEAYLLETIGRAIARDVSWSDVGRSIAGLDRAGNITLRRISRQGARQRFGNDLIVMRARLESEEDMLRINIERLRQRNLAAISNNEDLPEYRLHAEVANRNTEIQKLTERLVLVTHDLSRLSPRSLIRGERCRPIRHQRSTRPGDAPSLKIDPSFARSGYLHDHGEQVENIGSAIARRVVCLTRNPQYWNLVGFGEIRPGEKVAPKHGIWGTNAISPECWSDYDDLTPQERVDLVLMCTDDSGRRYRFGYARTVGAGAGIHRQLETQSSPSIDTSQHEPWARVSEVWN